MARHLGDDYRLYVAGTGATFGLILGQRDLTVGGSSQQIDMGSKDDGIYGRQAPGQKQVTITCEIVPEHPDATGYDRVKTVANDRDPVDFQIRYKPFEADDVVFEAECYAELTSIAMPRGGAKTSSLSLTLAAPPSVDTL